jgi:hypothetical protein
MFGAVALSRGSHWKVAAPGKPNILIVLARRLIKPFYVSEFVAMCDESKHEADYAIVVEQLDEAELRRLARERPSSTRLLWQR